jgi:hypothetical protein
VWRGVAKALLAFALGEKNIHNVSFKLTHEIRIMYASCLEHNRVIIPMSKLGDLCLGKNNNHIVDLHLEKKQKKVP